MQWRTERSRGPAGVELQVRRVVDPPAPPILLLHGLGVSGVVWQAFARRLLPRFAAVAPDLRGHGDSDAPPDRYQPLDYARDLVPLIEREGRPVPVVGHSLGALVALELAGSQPDLVPWVVLLDPPLDANLRNPEVSEVYRLRHRPPGELERYLLERNPNGGRFLAETLARLFRQATDDAFEAMLDRSQPDGTPNPTVRDVASLAGRVQQRVLVLQADPSRGGVLGDDAARAIVHRLPHGELRKIDGATHALHASHPEQVATAILDFASGTNRG
jgi:pimeloyl-ACP methyl ester carboxylesterase